MISWLVRSGRALSHGTEGAVQVTIEDNGHASVCVEEDERVTQGDEPGSDKALGGLALLGVVVDDEGLPMALATWSTGITEGT